MLDKFTSSDFAACLDQKFIIHLEAATRADAVLLQVAELPVAGPGAQRKPFSIVLRGPRDRRLPQRIYKVEHEKLGVLELFLVPIAMDDHGFHYEAVFN